MLSKNPLREADTAASTAVYHTDSQKRWEALCALLLCGPWLDLAKLLQMIEEEFDALRRKHRWNHTLLYTKERQRILCLAKLRLAWLQVQAESDPSSLGNADAWVMVRQNAAQTNAALGPLALGLEDNEWLELQEDEFKQIKELITDVARESVEKRSRNVICTARMKRSYPPRGIYQAPMDAYRYTEYYEDRDVSPRVLNSKVKGASGRPARMGIMELHPLEFAEYEESRRLLESSASA